MQINEKNVKFQRSKNTDEKKGVRQGDGIHHLLSKKESLLDHDPNNSINPFSEKVNTFIKLNKLLENIIDDTENIPTDNSGYSIKLVKSQKVSIGMEKAMAQGYYPEEQVRITLPKNTKQGKELNRLFEENKRYKTNYRLKYEYKGAEAFWDSDRNELVESELRYFETKEELENFKNKLKTDSNFKGIINEKEVEEWHHISGGGKNKLIDINFLVSKGFKVDTSSANKQFKLKIKEDYKSDMYYAKQKYIDRKNQENREIDTLTEEQHDVLQGLCAFRHEFHMNFDNFFIGERTDLIRQIDNGDYSPLNEELKEVGLPTIKWSLQLSDIPDDSWVDMDFEKSEDDFDTYEEYEKARYEFRDELYQEAYNDYEILNTDIENYLSEIDKSYGTSYAPTGIARARKYENKENIL